MHRRRKERSARRHASSLSERLVERGWSYRRIARFLRIAPRTLQRWRHDPRPNAVPLGRPATRSPLTVRTEILRTLDDCGPGLGVPTLRESFPETPRAELEDLVRRYRIVWRERNREPLVRLNWLVPGRVWAVDFTQTPRAIEGRFPYLLAVRDLASGATLLWQPFASANAEATVQSLAGLFARYDSPLVLKSDNGSHLTAGVVVELLRQHRVVHLRSPVYYPRYNGSVEAGIGGLKLRTDAAAARRGHPGIWTLDDVAEAAFEANAQGRPRGPSGPCPEFLWTTRTLVGDRERDRFIQCVESRIDAGLGGGVWDPELYLDCGRTRGAIRLALEECGYLTTESRRILPRIPRQ